MDDLSSWSVEARALEQRLIEAAEALLAHRGSTIALVPLPGRLPARCVAIGELARIREMVKPETLQA